MAKVFVFVIVFVLFGYAKLKLLNIPCQHHAIIDRGHANDILHTQYKEMTAYGGINIRTHFREYDDNRRVGIDVSWKFNATRSRYKGSHAGQSERDRL